VQVAQLQRTLTSLLRRALTLHRVPTDVTPPVLQLTNEGRPARFARCLQHFGDTRLEPCTYGKASSSKTVVVIGDSHAMEWMPALDEWAARAGYRIVALEKEACPIPDIEVFVAVTDHGGPGPYPQCTPWRDRAIADATALKPAAIVLVYGQENTANGRFDPATWTAGLQRSLDRLATAGVPIVDIGNNPRLSEDPGLCLSRAHADPATCTGRFLARSTMTAERGLVEQAGGTFIDVSPWLCVDDDHCPPIVDQRIVYADAGHLAAPYVSELEPILDASLRVAGLA
jgi:hypothetical protein